ncbi:MAG: HEAT repeat domain-containing protein [Bacteroidota bacterium]|nr:HEAT repeat domain-containing protein [Bacteroidota bacterium]
MKTTRVVLAVLLGVTFAFSATPENDPPSVNWSKAELNYKECLKSDNAGVKISSANYIRKYNLTGAVEELKSLLSKENSENVKMSGALALVTIGGSDGRTAIQNALETEENEIVAEFYRSILINPALAQN